MSVSIIEQLAKKTNLLTTGEVAALFNRHPDTIIGWVNRGHISAIRINGVLFYDPPVLAEELTAMSTKKTEAK